MPQPLNNDQPMTIQRIYAPTYGLHPTEAVFTNRMMMTIPGAIFAPSKLKTPAKTPDRPIPPKLLEYVHMTPATEDALIIPTL